MSIDSWHEVVQSELEDFNKHELLIH